jgi:hypothetical protein
MSRSASNALLAAALLGTVLLVLPGLGATALWQDEGQTAAVARNVLSTGLPHASDGTNTVSLFGDRRDIRDGIYIWQPWVPNYVAAASMAVFGADSFGARFPFALCLPLLVLAVFRFCARWQDDRVVTWSATVLTAGSVVMLLHARQCRYYVLAALLSLLVVDAWLRLRRGDGSMAVVRLAVASKLLFNSFPPGAVLLGAALAIDLAWPDNRDRRWRHVAVALGAVIVVNLPVAVYLRIWDRQYGVQPGYSDPGVFGIYLARYLLSLNLYFFPALIVAGATVMRWRSVVRATILRDPLTRVTLLVVVVQVVGFAAVSDYPFTRYPIGAAPFVFLLGARCIAVLSARNTRVAAALVAVTLATNVLGMPPLLVLRSTSLGKTAWNRAGIDGRLLVADDVGGSFARGEIGLLARTPVGSPLWDHVSELRRPPLGPLDAILEHLDRHAEPGDRVYAGYGDLSLMFHTPLEIRGKSDTDVLAPEFFVPRHFNPIHPQRLARQGVLRPNYTVTPLGVPDYQWNNSPDPLYHRFGDDPSGEAPELHVFRRTAD